MKLKNIARMSLALTLTFGVATAVTGCNRDDDTTQNEEEQGVKNQQELIAAFESNQTEVTLGDNIALNTAIEIDYAVTLNLNGKTISMVNDTIGDGVFHVISDGNLTINGEGTINGASPDNDYGMVIWADGGNVTINGGNYTNVGTKSTDSLGRTNNNEVIYAKNGSIVTINGGTFTGNNSKWILNSHDTLTGTFVVKGGKFRSFNPSSVETEPVGSNNNFVASGYKVTVNDGWYTVAEE